MLRISVTTLEKFRRYINDVSEYDTEAALIESLKGLFTGNDKTKFGGAFHAIIEHGEAKKKFYNGVEGYMADSLFFTKAQGDVAIQYRKDHPLMIHEMVVSKVYETFYFPIQVSGRVDSIEGQAIRDAKTKFRNPGDFKDYRDSYQWRFYLDMEEAGQFFYDLFEVKGFTELSMEGPHIIDPNVAIIPHDPFPCLAYESMQADCITLLNEFLEYIHHRNFIHLLKPANETAIF